MKKKIMALAVSAAMVSTAFAAMLPASAQDTGEKLVYKQDFSDASALERTTLRVGSTSATDKAAGYEWKAEDVNGSIENGVFKMKKVSAQVPGTSTASSKYAEIYEMQIKFGDNVVEETENTRTYLKTYKGTYKIMADAELKSTTQLGAFGPSGTSGAASAWKAPMPFVMETNGAFGYSIWIASNKYDAGYVGETAPFIESNADGNYKNTAGIVKKTGVKKIIFTVDTIDGTVKGDIEGYENGGVQHVFNTKDAGENYQLTGLRLAMKPNHKPDEYISVDNIEVYQVSLNPKLQAAVDAAAGITAAPVVYDDTVSLTDTAGGASVAWTSSNEDVINAQTGAVTRTDTAQAVTLTASVTTADGAQAYKDFYVTVAGNPQTGAAQKYSVTDGAAGNAIGFGAEITTGETGREFGFILNDNGKAPWYVKAKAPQITGGTDVKYGLVLEAEDSVDLSTVTAQSYYQDVAAQ